MIQNLKISDKKLRTIAEKIYSQTRLNEDDALTLFESTDLATIGELADFANQRINGKRVFYNVNRHINPTNICALSCKFCAFSRKPGEEGAYAYEIDEMVEKAGQALAQGATEVHMVGGLHPRWNFKRYLDMISSIHEKFPQLHIKAFTVVELDWMARRDRRTIADVLGDLKAAGLGSLPGGGAEIFHPEIRDQICDTKVSAEQWIDTHRLAHSMGMRSNCTMLYGHIENFFHRVDHMQRLRALQDETNGFNVFIPLAFQPYHNDMGIERYTFGFDDVKTLAVARLYLDNFKNIKAYWVMLGQDMAQVGLQFGANDLDGTVTEEKISRMAGGRSGMVMTRQDLEGLIRRCDRIPVERDTLYRPVIRGGAEAEPLHSQENMTPVKAEAIELDAHSTVETIAAALRQTEFWDLSKKSDKNLETQNSRHPEKIDPALIVNLGSETTAENLFSEIVQRIESSVTRFGTRPSQIVLNLEGLSALASEDASAGKTTVWATFLAQFEAVAKALSSAQENGSGESGFVSISLQGIRALASRLGRAGDFAHHIAEIKTLGTSWGISRLTVSETAKDYAAEDFESRRGAKILLASMGKQGFDTVHTLAIGNDAELGSGIDWQKFSEDLVELRNQSEAEGQCVIRLTAMPGADVMPLEFLRGLMVARTVLGSNALLVTPLFDLPTFSQTAKTSSLTPTADHHPAEKLATVALALGADHLGPIPVDHLNLVRILEDLAASGNSLLMNDESKEIYEDLWMNAKISAFIKSLPDLRHVPKAEKSSGQKLPRKEMPLNIHAGAGMADNFVEPLL